MKKYLCSLTILIISCFAISNAHAFDKIIGAFGIKLGQEFTPEMAEGTGSLTDGTPMYQFSPEKPFRSFSHYYALITPKTNKVYSIWGMGQQDNTAKCTNEQLVVMSILQKKYGEELKPGLLSSMRDVKTINQGDQRVITKCTGFGDITFEIRYTDTSLSKLAEQERIEIEASKVDAGGL